MWWYANNTVKRERRARVENVLGIGVGRDPAAKGWHLTCLNPGWTCALPAGRLSMVLPRPPLAPSHLSRLRGRSVPGRGLCRGVSLPPGFLRSWRGAQSRNNARSARQGAPGWPACSRRSSSARGTRAAQDQTFPAQQRFPVFDPNRNVGFCSKSVKECEVFCSWFSYLFP